MMVAVIGAGAVGGTIAALLASAGHDVEVTARGDHLNAIRESGIRLSGAWGTHTAAVLANESLTRRPELAFVVTKALEAQAAMVQNANRLEKVPVVVVQNGMVALQVARRCLPDSPVLGALALFAASYLRPGEVGVTTAGTVYLGSDRGSASPDPDAERAIELAASVLGTVLPVTVTRNFPGAQWTKLIVNQINALPAITGMSAQAVIGHRALRRVLTRSMREAVLAGIADGATFAPIQGLSNGMLRVFARLPIAIGQLLPLMMKWRMGATPNPGSTLQSIRRGQATEIDYLNGAVVDTGERTSVPTPVNAAIVAMVHEVERSARFLSPQEVIARTA